MLPVGTKIYLKVWLMNSGGFLFLTVSSILNMNSAILLIGFGKNLITFGLEKYKYFERKGFKSA